jgi:hypothetical protein
LLAQNPLFVRCRRRPLSILAQALMIANRALDWTASTIMGDQASQARRIIDDLAGVETRRRPP